MGLDSIIKSIISSNQQLRESQGERFAKLLEVMHSGTRDEFSSTIRSILDVTDEEGGEILGDDGSVEPDDGDSGDAEDEMGGPAAS